MRLCCPKSQATAYHGSCIVSIQILIYSVQRQYRPKRKLRNYVFPISHRNHSVDGGNCVKLPRLERFSIWRRPKAPATYLKIPSLNKNFLIFLVSSLPLLICFHNFFFIFFYMAICPISPPTGINGTNKWEESNDYINCFNVGSRISHPSVIMSLWDSITTCNCFFPRWLSNLEISQTFCLNLWKKDFLKKQPLWSIYFCPAYSNYENQLFIFYGQPFQNDSAGYTQVSLSDTYLHYMGKLFMRWNT